LGKPEHLHIAVTVRIFFYVHTYAQYFNYKKQLFVYLMPGISYTMKMTCYLPDMGVDFRIHADLKETIKAQQLLMSRRSFNEKNISGLFNSSIRCFFVYWLPNKRIQGVWY
jgi:hypothetical protein